MHLPDAVTTFRDHIWWLPQPQVTSVNPVVGFFDWIELWVTYWYFDCGSKYSLKLLAACIQMWWSFVPSLWWLSQNQRSCLQVRCDGGPALSVSLACVTGTWPCNLLTNCTEEVSCSSSSWTNTASFIQNNFFTFNFINIQKNSGHYVWGSMP